MARLCAATNFGSCAQIVTDVKSVCGGRNLRALQVLQSHEIEVAVGED